MIYLRCSWRDISQISSIPISWAGRIKEQEAARQALEDWLRKNKDQASLENYLLQGPPQTCDLPEHHPAKDPDHHRQKRTLETPQGPCDLRTAPKDGVPQGDPEDSAISIHSPRGDTGP